MKEELLSAAGERAARRAAEQSGLPDYAEFVELLRRLTAIDAAGLGPELARLRHALGLVPPQPPTLRGRLRALAGRTLSPLLWRLLRARGSADPFEAIYEILRRQLEWQLASEQRLLDELAALRSRLEALEHSRDGRGESG